MQVFSIAEGFNKVSTYARSELSGKGLDRLRAMTLWQETKDTGLIGQAFGVSWARLDSRRWLFSQWMKRFNPHDLSSLRERSHRPRRLRQPVRTMALSMLTTSHLPICLICSERVQTLYIPLCFCYNIP